MSTSAHSHDIGACARSAPARLPRRFRTTEERVLGLEEYRDDLQSELQAVEERLNELK